MNDVVVWMRVDPRMWTKTQVLLWLNWAIHEFSLENVVRSQFCLSGARLLQLSRDEFLRRAPPFVGDILYEHLEILQKGALNMTIGCSCSAADVDTGRMTWCLWS